MLRPATEAVLQTAPRADLERGRGRAGAAERTEQVGGEDRRPEFLGQAVKLARCNRLDRRRGAGIVDEEVEPAERRDRVEHHPLGAVRARDVAGGRDHGEALRAQPFDNRGAAGIIGQVVECDARAASGQELDRGQTDTGCRTRDQRGLAIKIAHPAPSAPALQAPEKASDNQPVARSPSMALRTACARP